MTAQANRFNGRELTTLVSAACESWNAVLLRRSKTGCFIHLGRFVLFWDAVVYLMWDYKGLKGNPSYPTVIHEKSSVYSSIVGMKLVFVVELHVSKVEFVIPDGHS